MRVTDGDCGAILPRHTFQTAKLDQYWLERIVIIEKHVPPGRGDPLFAGNVPGDGFGTGD